MSSVGTMSGRPVGLGHAVRDVDAEAVDAAVQPEPHRLLEVGDHLGVGEVQVGLLRREEVQVPLAVGHPGPRRAAEDRRPVVRRLAAVGRRGRRGTGSAPAPGEPGAAASAARNHSWSCELWLGTRSIGDPDAERVGLGEQRVELGQVAEDRLDVARVGDVVAVVGHRRGVERRDPQGVDAEVGEVGQPAADAGQVADAVAVRRRRSCGCRPGRRRVPPPVGGRGSRRYGSGHRLPGAGGHGVRSLRRRRGSGSACSAPPSPGNPRASRPARRAAPGSRRRRACAQPGVALGRADGERARAACAAAGGRAPAEYVVGPPQYCSRKPRSRVSAPSQSSCGVERREHRVGRGRRRRSGRRGPEDRRAADLVVEGARRGQGPARLAHAADGPSGGGGRRPCDPAYAGRRRAPGRRRADPAPPDSGDARRRPRRPPRAEPGRPRAPMRLHAVEPADRDAEGAAAEGAGTACTNDDVERDQPRGAEPGHEEQPARRARRERARLGQDGDQPGRRARGQRQDDERGDEPLAPAGGTSRRDDQAADRHAERVARPAACRSRSLAAELLAPAGRPRPRRRRRTALPTQSTPMIAQQPAASGRSAAGRRRCPARATACRPRPGRGRGAALQAARPATAPTPRRCAASISSAADGLRTATSAPADQEADDLGELQA